MRKNDHANAIAAFTEAINLKPDDWWCWHERAWIHQSLGEHEQAVADHTRAIALNEGDVVQVMRRARSYEALGENEKAEADYGKALTLPEVSRQPTFVNGSAWHIVSNPASRINPRFGVGLAENAVAAAPADGGIWKTLGVARYRTGDWKGAIDALSKSMELRKGGDGNDWFFIAMAHWQLGDEDQARHWYDRAATPMEEKPTKNNELRGFRAEAEALLKIGSGSAAQPPPIAATKPIAD